MKLHPAHGDLGPKLHKSLRVSIRVNVISEKNIENCRSLSGVWPLGIVLCVFHLLYAPDSFPVTM